MAQVSNYEYVQSELPFKVYGGVLLRIRSKLGLTQKDFSEVLNVSAVVYNKIEMPLTRGSSQYLKPSEQFYNSFCSWFKKLSKSFQSFIINITDGIVVTEIKDNNATKANRYLANVSYNKPFGNDTIFNFNIKSLTGMSRDGLKEIEDFLLLKGIVAYVH